MGFENQVEDRFRAGRHETCLRMMCAISRTVLDDGVQDRITAGAWREVYAKK